MEKVEKEGRRTYTKEFKLEAVRLVRTGIAMAERGALSRIMYLAELR